MTAKELCERINPVDILDMLPGMVMVVDSQGEIAYANNAAEAEAQKNMASKNCAIADARREFLKGFARSDKIIRGETQSPSGDKTLRFISNPFTICRNDDISERATIILANDPSAEESFRDHIFSLFSEALLKLRSALDGIKELTKKDNASENIDHEIDRIVHMTDDLRRLVKIDSGEQKRGFKKTDADISEIIKNVSEKLSPVAEKKGLNLRVSGGGSPVVLPLDESIAISVEVLMRNAITYTPSGGDIVMDIEESENELSIAVMDSGPGISADEQASIFNRFYSDSQNGRALKSTGIGLYIAKQIVELHEGTLWVESAPGKGSVFTISIPRV